MYNGLNLVPLPIERICNLFNEDSYEPYDLEDADYDTLLRYIKEYIVERKEVNPLFSLYIKAEVFFLDEHGEPETDYEPFFAKIIGYRATPFLFLSAKEDYDTSELFECTGTLHERADVLYDKVDEGHVAFRFGEYHHRILAFYEVQPSNYEGKAFLDTI